MEESMSIEKVYKPKFWPNGWRLLKLTESPEEGDFYWSKKVGYWVAIAKFGDECPTYLPVIRRENPLPTIKEYICLLEDVGSGKVTGTFAGNPELKEACRFADLVLDKVPIIIEMAASGCVSGTFNDWPQLRQGCIDVAKALSMRQSVEERRSGRSPISASPCCLSRRSGSS
jgi:hypothetical protein